MFAWILKLLGGSLVSELRGAIADWSNAKTEAERIAAKERVDTLAQIVESQRIHAQVVSAGMQHGGKVFWSVWALFAVPLGLWFAAVNLDSLFLFSGNIPDLPPSVRPWADQIFNNLFWTGGGVAGATVLANMIGGRR